ncbi:MAG: transcriptional repressor NrdR [Candidatus Aenigmatarchaeota archaeon]|nr:MAG: transcriptional repressor NrdR [Candidatus Aenigmarchaeota archaeon]
MNCPYCAHTETRVVDKRESEDESTRRRRECTSCVKRFTTYERVESLDMTVVKRNGAKEPFMREKILMGMKRACEKRPITDAEIEEAVDSVERVLRRRKSTEVKSTDIGDLVLRKLKALDEVAYIRFASVYQSFESAKAFAKEVAALKI